MVIISLIYFNQGSKIQVVDICKSLKGYVKNDCVNRGQFLWLYTPISEHMNISLKFKSNLKCKILLIKVIPGESLRPPSYLSRKCE